MLVARAKSLGAALRYARGMVSATAVGAVAAKATVAAAAKLVLTRAACAMAARAAVPDVASAPMAAAGATRGGVAPAAASPRRYAPMITSATMECATSAGTATVISGIRETTAHSDPFSLVMRMIVRRRRRRRRVERVERGRVRRAAPPPPPPPPPPPRSSRWRRGHRRCSRGHRRCSRGVCGSGRGGAERFSRLAVSNHQREKRAALMMPRDERRPRRAEILDLTMNKVKN